MIEMKGEKVMYDPKVKRIGTYGYVFELPAEIEEIAERVLSQQPSGGMITCNEETKLRQLAPTQTYEGENWIAQRRIVDQLDQVTFSRIRK